MSAKSAFQVEALDRFWRCSFSAMASPCEVLFELETGKRKTIKKLTAIAYNEASRIEKKFSRYREDNLIYKINHANGKTIKVDEETARLLDYADQLFQLSEGLFDITSGVLRRVWRFDGSDKIPTDEEVATVMPLVGWSKVKWQNPEITLPPGMEIDLGGIGKEYAVDRTAQLLKAQTSKNFLVNYGGDLYASGPLSNNEAWNIGLDDPAHTGENSLATLELKRGAIATSGDARRYLLRDGIRYSHILDPRSGWP
ncbi:MAG: FAD:protein FMN transferase, partial [Gammaproteobacteria bacterium]|nr:FAD:protein FMN transferase [Gammaproteobacteria bacterium]